MRNRFIISKDLRKILKEINNPLSKRILQIRYVDESKEWINHLNIAQDDNNKISYVDKKRYEAYKKEDLFTSELSNYKKVKIKSRYVKVYKNDYIDFGTHDFSFHIDKRKFFYADFRYMASCGKVVRKILGEVDNKILSDFCEKFIAKYNDATLFDKRYQVEFVSGEDIRTWYLEKNYLNLSGSLGASCMRYSECQDYFDIYVDCPECQLFIVKSEDKLIGRCLLWKNIYFDRVYATHGVLEKEVILYLKHLGFLDMYSNNTNETINLKHLPDKYPYMDSFKYLNLNSKTISTACDDYDYELIRTNGLLEDEDEEDNNIYCEISQEDIPAGESVYINGLGYVHERYATYSERYGRSILEEDSIITHDGDYIFGDEAVELDNGKYCHEDEDYYELYNGDYTMKDVVNSPYNEGFIKLEDAIEDEVFGWILESQIDEIETLKQELNQEVNETT